MTRYIPRREDVDKLAAITRFHPAKDDQPDRYENNREVIRKAGMMFLGNCPPGRDLSLAIGHLQDALLHANAAIAIEEDQ
jgi:hypothetical protein